MDLEVVTLDADQKKLSVDPRNKLNELTAKEWITRTVSVLVQKGLGKNSKDAQIERLHPAPFSYQDVSRFVEFFTKSEDTVLDPFCGVGSTLKASLLLGRNAVGVELNPEYVELTHERLRTEIDADLFDEGQYTVHEGDIRQCVDLLPDDSVQFVITSPPYWGILNKIDHKAKQERLERGVGHNYGLHDRDLAHIADYTEFLETLGDVFDQLARPLEEKKYMVVIVGDFRHKDKYFMFHSDLAVEIQKNKNFVLKGITIIYQKFKRVFPYGYPYSFVPNIHHQYALVFQKI